MDYLIGTDIGTSGTKSILMNTKGELIAQDLEEYDVLTPHPLWAEQWPDVWLKAVKDSIRKTVAKSKVNPTDIKGIGISGLYGGSGIPVDEKMEPVRPALIWMDRRAREMDLKVAQTRAAENKMFVVRASSAEQDVSYLVTPAGATACTTFCHAEQLACALILQSDGLSKTVYPGTDIVRSRIPNAYKELIR